MENNDNHQSQPSYPQQMENRQMEALSDFKRHKFPLHRIKRIMKSDPNVGMVSAEAPILFSKACEMFLADLTMRSWLHADENKRRIILKSDISGAVARTCTFDFLVDILPKESFAAVPGFVAMPHPDSGIPPEAVMETLVVDGSGMYSPRPTQATAAVDDGENEAEENEGNGSGD